MISFVNFARIASICVGFDLGTLHGYFFHQDFWPNLNFPLEYLIKLVLICYFSLHDFYAWGVCSGHNSKELLPRREIRTSVAGKSLLVSLIPHMHVQN